METQLYWPSRKWKLKLNKVATRMLKMRLEAPRDQQHPLTEQAEIQIRTTTLQTTRKLTISMKTQKSAPMTTSFNPFSQRSPISEATPKRKLYLHLKNIYRPA